MLNLADVDESTLNQSIRVLLRAAQQKGWTVYVPYEGSSIVIYEKPSGSRILSFSTCPSTSSFAAAYLVNDKYATYNLLEESGLPVLPTILVDDPESNLETVFATLDAKSVVVKPVDGGHGKGITTNVSTTEELHAAVKLAFDATRFIQKIVIQKMYDQPKDLRMLCINNTFVAATLRIPARVFGDGVHTTSELIDIENQQPHRGEPYKSKLATIDRQQASLFLASQIERIPAKDECVEVLGVANYGQGGETQDITDDVPAWLARYAEQASRAASLPVCGVDFLIKELPAVDATESALEPVITEINKSPSFFIHESPTHGQSRPVGQLLIDYIDGLF